MNYTNSHNIIARNSADYHKYDTKELTMNKANLINLTNALGEIFYNFTTYNDDIPAQAKYNHTIISLFEKYDFFKLYKILDDMCSYDNTDFSYCTVFLPMSKLPRPTREEFEQYKHFYVHNKNLYDSINNVYPTEIIRGIRLLLSSMLFKFFNTYDVNETFVSKDNKKHYVCDSSRAFYLSRKHQKSSSDFCSFITLLIDANRYFTNLTPELSEFIVPMREAGKVAKVERQLYYKSNKDTI